MLNVGVVGIGNAGSQVAALAMEKLSVDVLAINSSEKDLQTLPESVPQHLSYLQLSAVVLILAMSANLSQMN